MAFDLITKKHTGKNWACNIGSDSLVERAKPVLKKPAVIGLAAGVAGALGYLFWRDHQRTAHIHRRLRLPT